MDSRARLMMSRLLMRKQTALFSCWKVWQQTLKQTKLRVVQRLTNLALAGAFGQWVASVGTLQRATVVMGKIVGRMMQRTLAAAFAGWAENVSAQRQMKRVARKVLMRLTQRCLYGSFATWADFTNGRKLAKMNVFRMMQSMNSVLLRQSLRYWHKTVGSTVQARQIAEDACMQTEAAWYVHHFTYSSCGCSF
jgi:hypothetical protein